jgi:membrane-bound lytic murein transglycosylase B
MRESGRRARPSPDEVPPRELPPGRSARPPYVARLLLACALVGAAVLLIVTIGVRNDEPAPPSPVPDRGPQPRAAAPPAALPAPEDRPNASDQAALDEWANDVAGATGIPARVAAAYGRAEMWLRSQRPDCNLSWATLAGIGRVESGHGTAGGGRIGADGLATRPIIGVPLDGSPGVRAVRDTDGGRLDGDRTWDRAVGPMQFLPQTWATWSARASSDGARPDPQNIDDVALTAGRYLCSSGADLTTAAGWWDAVLVYNRSVEYAQDVFVGAENYASATTP